MPCFTGKITNGKIIINCGVGIPLKKSKGSVPDGGYMGCKALVDTGAQQTCISRKVAKLLKLSHIGEGKIIGANGESIVRHYMVSVGIGVGVLIDGLEQEQQKISFTGIGELKVSRLENDFGADVLLGMDVIQILRFTIHNGDGFTICI